MISKTVYGKGERKPKFCRLFCVCVCVCMQVKIKFFFVLFDGSSLSLKHRGGGNLTWLVKMTAGLAVFCNSIHWHPH